MASTVSFKKKAAASSGATSPSTPATPAATPTATVPPTAKSVNNLTPNGAEPKLEPAPAETPKGVAEATQEAGKVVTADHYKGIGGFEGEFTSADMATPYLTLCQKQGKLFDEHPDWLGQWVYDKEICLGSEVRVVFLRAKKYYTEDLEYGSDQIPQRFATMAEVRAAGLNEGGVKETADLDLLIEVDATVDGVSDLAHIIEGDRAYVLARYTVRSTAYGKTVGILAKDSSSFLKGNLINGFYRMTTLKRANADTSWFVPVLKTDGKTSDPLRGQIIDRMTIGGA